MKMLSSHFWRRVFIHRWQRRLKDFSKISRTLEDKERLLHRSIFSDQKFFSHTSKLWQQHKGLPFDVADFPVERIRNFSIIAHVDHGKSTLADRLLEISGTIPEGNNMQVLDRLQVERERGITVKAQTASLVVNHKGQDFLLNLIDTPGHVDFHYEVSRSLAACHGVILLVDANQISAKSGLGVADVIEAVIERVPCPQYDRNKPLRAFVFDSWYDKFKGVVAHVAICDGVARKGEKITCASSQKVYEITEIGLMYPTQVPSGALFAGQVGYAMMNMRNTSEAQIGDTFYHENQPVEPMPGFKEATPMVFAGMFPTDQSEFPQMRSAIEKLTLNDRSVQIKVDNSPALGQGYRLGFLGLLHMDVFNQRLEQEFDASVIVTAPNVAYQMTVTGEKNIKYYGSEDITVLNPCLMPEPSNIAEYREPMVKGTIISPDDYINQITGLCLDRRGRITDQSYIDDKRVMFQVNFPLAEILVDFFDELKSISSGYASFDYEDAGYEISDLVKLEFYLNGKDVEELTLICHVSRARDLARQVCLKLKDTIPRQQFAISVQGKVNAKVLAREDIKAYRKDVTAKCYGGDISRKRKLLKQQAEGKKRLRKIGNIDVPKDTFIQILKK
ncbi:translation factor GUF1, mitochondrial isoform X2 [Aplysia californica]|uniref:Translation factor GUF1 homolog, mitochondrial n=1 Tax=Aplysia californica TaxID=6500 RepID=A0ABM1ACC5_APLCA|nr:translation factor GUF1, mitochondrial isoform X2 [Aplysia californica]